MAEAGGTIELRRVVSDEDVDTFLMVRQAIDPEHAIARAAYVQHIATPGRVDREVGYATLHDAGAESDCALTGVRAAWRGRGIARALKRAQVAAAKAAGLRELRTTTAVSNAPMLQANERLGYRRGVAWIHLRGPLLD